MSDTNTPAHPATPTVDNRVLPEGSPEPDHNRAGTDDVPSSDKPDDINDGLKKDPELNSVEALTKRLEEINAAFVKAKEEAKSIEPGNVEAIEANRKVQQQLAQEGFEITERIKKLAEATNNKSQAAGNGGLKIAAPVLEKAWEYIMKLLEQLFDLIKGGLRKVGIMKPAKGAVAATKDGQEADAKKETGAADATPATPEEVADTFNGALDQSGKRMQTVKEENAKLAEEAERTKEASGLGPKAPKL
jgi:hypothetical protein